MRKHVALIVTLGSATGRYGGPWSVVQDQAVLLRDAGFGVTVVYGYLTGDAPENLPAGIFWQGHQVRRWAPLPRFSGLMSFSLARTLWTTVRTSDLTHVSFARDLIPMTGAVIAQLSGRPVLLQPHGMLEIEAKSQRRVTSWFVRPILNRAQAIAALTGHEKSHLKAHYRVTRVPIVVIGNPVRGTDDQIMQGKATASKEVLFLARLHPRKKADVFIRAAALARAETPDWKWSIVGPSDVGVEHLHELNAALGEPCIFEGPVSPESVAGRVAEASIFVQPSTNEPFGLVMVIAMMLGKAVVLTSSAALSEIVGAHQAGYVVKDDDPQDLAAAVSALTESQEARRMLGGNATDLWRSHFSSEAYRRGFLLLIEEALTRHSACQ